jgi:hypothetical protein
VAPWGPSPFRVCEHGARRWAVLRVAPRCRTVCGPTWGRGGADGSEKVSCSPRTGPGYQEVVVGLGPPALAKRLGQWEEVAPGSPRGLPAAAKEGIGGSVVF